MLHFVPNGRRAQTVYESLLQTAVDLHELCGDATIAHDDNLLGRYEFLLE